ncbi:MAG: hypothetical protein ACLP9L_38650 [Thermoguttaceae bacterium]
MGNRGLPLVGYQLQPTRDYTILERADSHREAGSAVRTSCAWHDGSGRRSNAVLYAHVVGQINSVE